MSIIEKLELRQKIVGTANTNYSAFNGFEVEAGSVYRVIQIANKTPYVAMSANRDKYTPKENKERNAKLLGQIKAKGLFAYEMIGGWEEEYEKDGEKKTKQVVENSFFIPFDGRRTLIDFIEFFVARMKEWEQDAILLGLPKGFDYKDWKWKNLEIGNHYFVSKDGKCSKAGSEATLKTFDKFGSIALDPKKNRAIEWVVAGVTKPGSSSGCFLMDKAGLKWFWDSFPEVKASDFEGETRQRAVQKILDSHYRKVEEKR